MSTPIPFDNIAEFSAIREPGSETVHIFGYPKESNQDYLAITTTVGKALDLYVNLKRALGI